MAVLELEHDKGNSPQIRLCEIGLWKAEIYNPKATEKLSKNHNYPGSKQAKLDSPEPRDRETPTALSGGCTEPVVAVENKPEEHSHSWGWGQGTMDSPPSQGEMQGLLSPMWAQLSGHTCQGMSKGSLCLSPILKAGEMQEEAPSCPCETEGYPL